MKQLLSSLPIRTHMLIMVALMAAVPLGTIIYTGIEQRRSDLQAAREEVSRLAYHIQSEQDGLLSGAEQVLDMLSRFPAVQKRDTRAVNALLKDIVARNPQYANLVMIDKFGLMWAASAPSRVRFSYADRRYFRNALSSGRFSSGEYTLGRLLQKPVLAFGAPIRDHSGTITGVAAVVFTMEKYLNLLKNLRFPEGSSILLLDHKGTILYAAHDPGQVGKQDRVDIFRHMTEGPDEGTFEGTGNSATRRIIAYRKLRLPGEETPYMYVRTSMPLDAVLQGSNRTLLLHLSILSSLLLFSIGFALLISKRCVIDKIIALRNAARRLAHGDLESKVSGHVSGGELGELGRAFDDMADSLSRDNAERKRAESALAEKQRQLETLNALLEERIAVTVNEIRQKDQMLIQQSRLASMGEMINNIAHQWRQPLNNVGLIVQNLMYGFESGQLTPQDMEEQVEAAMDTIKFMSRTIDDFRNFFRQDKEKQPFPLSDTLSGAIEFVSPGLRNNSITVDLELRDAVVAFGYRNEYSQVLLNILNNARDVLTERRIANPLIRIRAFSENGWAVVTIWDNGGGINEDVLPRIFDPYFSTKEPGKGTGIGLYMSKAIIEQNMGGKLTARTIDGGAEFRIELPPG